LRRAISVPDARAGHPTAREGFRSDSETRYVAGQALATDFAISNKLGYWRRDFFTNGILRETHLDRDRDGQLDEKILFDQFGTFLRVEPMK
jgi:hypothetical protein